MGQRIYVMKLLPIEKSCAYTDNLVLVSDGIILVSDGMYLAVISAITT